MLTIEHWLDSERSRMGNVKFWQVQAVIRAPHWRGMPCAALSCLQRKNPSEASGRPFSFAAPMDGSFRIDWRRELHPFGCRKACMEIVILVASTAASACRCCAITPR